MKTKGQIEERIKQVKYSLERLGDYSSKKEDESELLTLKWVLK